MMRILDLQTWPRRELFETFSRFDHPHFGLCANVEVTSFYPFVKRRGLSFSVASVYVITRAANAIPEFRYRIRQDMVVEHEVVHPSTTILTQGDLFTFCTFDYVEDFARFAGQAVERIAEARQHPSLENVPGKDDMLYMTSIPWVSFTGLMHPLNLNPPDSVPRFAWGKFFQDGERLWMPLSAQGHHALMDGFHLGRFYALVQEYLDAPEVYLGG
jgi:chloramphenicol O-acetyltransferase type A